MISDGFEQADFAVPNRLSGSEIETQCESRHTASLAEAIGICSDAVGLSADRLSFPASPARQRHSDEARCEEQKGHDRSDYFEADQVRDGAPPKLSVAP